MICTSRFVRYGFPRRVWWHHLQLLWLMTEMWLVLWSRSVNQSSLCPALLEWCWMILKYTSYVTWAHPSKNYNGVESSTVIQHCQLAWQLRIPTLGVPFMIPLGEYPRHPWIARLKRLLTCFHRVSGIVHRSVQKQRRRKPRCPPLSLKMNFQMPSQLAGRTQARLCIE